MPPATAADYDLLDMSDATDSDNLANEAAEEETTFSVLRRDSEEPIGPLSAEQILEMLKNDELSRKGFVFYEGMEDWMSIDSVFEIQEQISHFVDDGQDKEAVADAFQEVNTILAQGESIYYIAVQDRTGLLSKSKDSVILTDRRILVLRRKRAGFEMEAFTWKAVTNTLMRDDGNGSGTFSVLLNREKNIDINHIATVQIHRLFKLSQELNDASNGGD
jgi:hypothetical protein